MADPLLPKDADDARVREARATLDRLAREGDGALSSSMAQAARRATDHFRGRDAVGAGPDGETDAAELWGRRIGRTLSMVAFLVLLVYLWRTYVS
jgi:hypothetical protein